jgi:putative PEP-CTERM system histidine kinase
MHDIKNLVSQLSLVARNAERHADNPEFRADMVATLQSSVGKMNDLLARLSQHNKGRAEEPRPIALKALADAVAASRRASHGVEVEGRADVIASADPVRLEQALAHLVQNAIDASGGGDPVAIRVALRGNEAVMDVIDHGAGMSPEFVRTRLFKPFASTKQDGFGVGAYEARTLVAAMGGRLEVESREGEGSRFSIVLPLATRGGLTGVAA